MTFEIFPAENTTLAQAYCEGYNWRPELVFRYQYVIAQKADKTAGLAGWKSHEAGDWVLRRDPDLNTAKIVDSSDKTVGYCCGWAIGPNDKLIKARLKLPFKQSDPDFLERLESLSDDIRGRYVILIDTGKSSHVFGDPVGDMGIVFDPRARRVGASVPVVLTRQIDTGGLSTDDVKKGKAVYRFGATADKGVFRLTPNHSLNLSDFSARRFWPRDIPEIVRTTSDIEAVTDGIGTRLKTNMLAFANGLSVALPISGGFDSTILLGLCHEAGIKPDFTYTHRNNWISGYDAISARRTCEDLGFDHVFLDAFSLYGAHEEWTLLARAEPHLRWVRAGFCLPMVKRRQSLAALLLPPADVVLRGNVMEMLGGRFHKSHSVGHMEDAYKMIFGRQPENPAERRVWENGYAGWLANLPSNLPEKAGLDLSFIENLFPNAMGVTLQSTPLAFYLNPFTDRRLIAETMRVPSDYRVSGDLYTRLLTRNGRSIPTSPLTLGKSDPDQELMQAFLKETRSDTERLEQGKLPVLC